jgi:hypothetical protein
MRFALLAGKTERLRFLDSVYVCQLDLSLQPLGSRFKSSAGSFMSFEVYTVYRVHHFLYIMLFSNFAYDKLVD